MFSPRPLRSIPSAATRISCSAISLSASTRRTRHSPSSRRCWRSIRGTSRRSTRAASPTTCSAALPTRRHRTGPLAIDPDDQSTRNNLGLSLALSGDYDQAIAILGKLTLEPGATPRMRQNLSLALGLKGAKEDAARVSHGDLDQASIDANQKYFDAVRALMSEPAPAAGKAVPGKS